MWQVEPPSHSREGPLMVQCGVNLASFLFQQQMKYLVIGEDSGSAPYVDQPLIVFKLGTTSLYCRSKSSRQVSSFRQVRRQEEWRLRQASCAAASMAAMQLQAERICPR